MFRDDWLVHTFLGFLRYHQICAQIETYSSSCVVLPCRRPIGELPVTSFGGYDLGDVFFPWDTANKGPSFYRKQWKMGQILYVEQNSYSRWWQLNYFVFSPLPWEGFPFWLIFFRWVGSTTNQWGGSWIALERLSPKMVPRRWWWHLRRPEASGISCGGKSVSELGVPESQLTIAPQATASPTLKDLIWGWEGWQLLVGEKVSYGFF